jgi:hypothetical protein
LGVVVVGGVAVGVVGPAALGVQAKKQRRIKYPRRWKGEKRRFILAIK